MVNDRIRSNGFFFSLAELLNSGNRRFHLPCDGTSVERECSAEDVSEVSAHRLLDGISIELARLCRRERVARHRFAADREATARRLHCPLVVLAPQYRQQLRRPHYLNLPTPVNRAPDAVVRFDLPLCRPGPPDDAAPPATSLLWRLASPQIVSEPLPFISV